MDIKQNAEFQHLGYFIEYHSGGKYLGCSDIIQYKDRYEIGYKGRIDSLADSDFKVGKHKIKKGQKITTYLYPLCGKIKNK